MDEVVRLTLRQIEMIYYRKRSKHGVPNKIDGSWYKDDDMDFAKKQFYEMGINVFNKSIEQLDLEWEEELKNGQSE